MTVNRCRKASKTDRRPRRGSCPQARRKPFQYRPGLESLEQRIVPALVQWVGAQDGDWNTPENWDGGAVPGPDDDVEINVAGITVTHTDGTEDAVHSLTSQANLVMANGALTGSKTATVSGALDLTAGTLGGAGDWTVTGTFHWSGGTFGGTGKLVAEGGLEVSGVAVLDGG